MIFKIRIPGGRYKVDADSSKEAINKAVLLFKSELEEFVSSGKAYQIVESYDGLKAHELKKLEPILL